MSDQTNGIGFLLTFLFLVSGAAFASYYFPFRDTDLVIRFIRNVLTIFSAVIMPHMLLFAFPGKEKVMINAI